MQHPDAWIGRIHPTLIGGLPIRRRQARVVRDHYVALRYWVGVFRALPCFPRRPSATGSVIGKRCGGMAQEACAIPAPGAGPSIVCSTPIDSAIGTGRWSDGVVVKPGNDAF